MKKFFYQDFIGIFQVITNSSQKDLQLNIDPQFNSFLCDFYTEALAACLITLFSEKKKYNQKQLIDYIMLILQISIPDILKKLLLINQIYK